MKPDIYLLGSGIHGVLQLTAETEQALRSCASVYVLHDDLMVHEYVKRCCADTHDLAAMYDGHTVRQDAYRAISERLVLAATKQRPVALLTHGHPLFLVSATEYTLSLAKERGLSVRMLPGVSSFDTILCELGIDYGYGVQLFDATTMIRNEWFPNRRIPMLVFQLSTTLIENVIKDAPGPETLAPLVRHLLHEYPREHECTVVHSSAHLLERPTLLRLPLAELDQSDELELWKRPTLYVPPVG